MDDCRKVFSVGQTVEVDGGGKPVRGRVKALGPDTVTLSFDEPKGERRDWPRCPMCDKPGERPGRQACAVSFLMPLMAGPRVYCCARTGILFCDRRD